MGTLYIVATPIGNLEDITVRAIKILTSVAYIACEDTRRAGMLLDELRKRYPEYASATKPQFISYYDQVESTRTPEIIGHLINGESVALISDAGTPLINDPGYVLVSEARKRQINVLSVPGASAFLAALTSSGLPMDTFMFLGYPPEKQSHRLKLFAELPKGVTIVFYCAPHKLISALKDLQQITGDIGITLARELTKIHEEIWTGTITDAQNHFINPKGEFVLLFRIE